MPVSTPKRLAHLVAIGLLLASGAPVAAATDDAVHADTDHGASVDIRSKNEQPPRYPAEAVRDRLSGTTMVHVDVDAEGRVVDVRVRTSSGHPALDAAAVEAATHWTYNPGMRDRRPQPGFVWIPVTFQL